MTRRKTNLSEIKKGERLSIAGCNFLALGDNRFALLKSLGNMTWKEAMKTAKEPDEDLCRKLREKGIKTTNVSLMTRKEAWKLKPSERQTLYDAVGNNIWLADACDGYGAYYIHYAGGMSISGGVSHAFACVPVYTLERIRERTAPSRVPQEKPAIKDIADFYGTEAQTHQLVEEMAELTQALNKLWRKTKFETDLTSEEEKELTSHVAEEIADVKVCLEQVEYLLGIENSVTKWKEMKIKRQQDRILQQIAHNACLNL